MKFKETKYGKVYSSDTFNYTFDKNTGRTVTFGETKEEDPDCAPFPLIVDFEITERCSGIGNAGPCKFCYKSNTANKGSVTSLELAKKVIDALPREVTQIAFGADAKLESNPDWFEIFQYSRKSGFIPNVTVADITQETANKLAAVCGAVAVSRYDDKNFCYDSIARLNKAFWESPMSHVTIDANRSLPVRSFDGESCGTFGNLLEEFKPYIKNSLFPTNIHIMLSKETLPNVLETLDDIGTDPRLDSLNAVVFLSLKRKGRGEKFHTLSDEEFGNIVKICNEKGISYGFDSCSCRKWERSISHLPNFAELSKYGEPCESSLQSAYINVHGEYFPCSFTEGTLGWETGIPILDYENFFEVWNHPRVQVFREKLLMCNRECPIYNV